MTDYYCRDNGNDGNDGLSDANAVTSPNVLTGLLGAADRGRFNRADTWLYGSFGTDQFVNLSSAGSGSAETSRTRVDAYGTGVKPNIDWEWNNPGDQVAVCNQQNDFQRVTDIKFSHIGPEDSASNDGGRGCHNDAGVDSPEWYGVEIDGAFRDGIVNEDYVGTAVADGCDVTNTNRSRESGFDWGGGISHIRTMNGPVVAGITRNCTVHEQWGEAFVQVLGEDALMEHNWAWSNWALQYYSDCSRSSVFRLNRAEGGTNTDFHRSGGACGACYGYDIEDQHSQSRAQQADDGGVHFYLNLGSFCTAGVYWPEYGNADAGSPASIKFENLTLVDCNTTIEFYTGPGSGSDADCALRCIISMPLSSGMTHDNGNGFHTGSIQIGPNYWDDSEDAMPHADLQGGGDVYDTVLSLGKMSGWRLTNGDLLEDDYKPESREAATDTGYDQDFDSAEDPMDEFGAFKFGDDDPEPEPEPEPSALVARKSKRRTLVVAALRRL